MNEATAKLIEELAAKLGTTAEHLWGVLVRQAPISATVNAALTLAWVVALVCGWRFAVRSMKLANKDSIMHDEVVRACVIVTLILVSIATAVAITIGSVGCVSAFANPE
ncbi:MAG: hypothetical protein WBI79_06225, partial [Kiritimatiellia bacterium]